MFLDINQRFRSVRNFISRNKYNILFAGHDGGIYASVEGGVQPTTTVTDGSTYNSSGPPAGQIFNILLKPTPGPILTLTVDLPDPWVHNPVFAPYLILSILDGVGTMTVGGNVSTQGFPLTITVPAGGAAYWFQWNGALALGDANKWQRIS